LLHKGHGKLLQLGFFDVFFANVVAFDYVVGSDVCVLFGSPRGNTLMPILNKITEKCFTDCMIGLSCCIIVIIIIRIACTYAYKYV